MSDFFRIPNPIIHQFGIRELPRSQHVGWQIKAYNLLKLHTQGIDGSGVNVGVGDTGVSKTHIREELANVVKAESFVGGLAYDKHFHGSHCQSIVQAIDNGSGMLGVAPGATGYHAKVLSDSGSGGSQGIAKGIDWLADKGCEVISLSLGAPSASSYINDAIKAATSAGVLVFGAAGNDGRSNNVDWPGAGEYCHAIAAHDRALNTASFSDRGPQVVHSSPGVGIYGCSVNGFTEASGTSMATPFAAGCAALVIQAEKKAYGERRTKTPDQYRDLVKKFAVDRGIDGFDNTYGWGLFDVVRCVEWILSQKKEPEPPKPPVNDWEDVGAGWSEMDSKYRYKVVRQLRK